VGRDRLPVLVAVALAGFAAVWLGYTKVWALSGGEPLAWRDAGAQLSRVQFPRATYEIFRDRDEFTAFFGERVEAAVQLPAIDFDRDLAVLVALGPRSSTGYGVRVESVTETRGRVLIEAGERSPSRGQTLAARVDYPLSLIVIRDVGKPVTFEWSR
jgi:hypothetical protein